MNSKIIISSLLIFSVASLVAHDNHSETKTSSVKWQIEAYTGAAPDFIGDFAAVIGSDGTIIREGTNGWTCLAFTANMMGDSICLLYTSPSPRD